MAKTIPVRDFRSNLAHVLSDVADRREHVVLTRNGRPAAALVPIDEYEALEETAEILSDADAVRAWKRVSASPRARRPSSSRICAGELAERRAAR